MTAVRSVLSAGASLGENALWLPSEQALYWLDLLKTSINRFDPATGSNRLWKLDVEPPLGMMVRTADAKFLLADRSGLHWFDPASEQLEFWVDPNEGRADIAFNDGKIDRQGRLWVCTDDLAEVEPRGCLYRVDPDGSYRMMEAGFVVGNGPAFAPDGKTLYLSDTVASRILAFTLDPMTGALSERRAFVTFDPADGYPDGLTVDAEGYLWCAHWDGGRVSRFAPDGALVYEIAIPAPNVTSVAFGGADLSTLFITTARDGMDDQAIERHPEAGAIFAVDPNIRGLEEPRLAN